MKEVTIMTENENTTEKKKYGWGGRRPNQTGRPKGTVNPDGQRKQHQVRAYEDEWLLIKEFTSMVKKDIDRAEALMKEYRNVSESDTK